MEELKNEVMGTVDETNYDLPGTDTDVDYVYDSSQEENSGALKVIGGLALLGGAIAGGVYLWKKKKAKVDQVAELEAEIAELRRLVKGDEPTDEDPVDAEFKEVEADKPEASSNKKKK